MPVHQSPHKLEQLVLLMQLAQPGNQETVLLPHSPQRQLLCHSSCAYSGHARSHLLAAGLPAAAPDMVDVWQRENLGAGTDAHQSICTYANRV
jgi:hypothetical protein